MTAARIVTFVGLGAIGLPMALHIHAAGYDIVGVNRGAARREKAAAEGLRAEPAIDSAARADTVVIMVATPEQFLDVTLGPGGLVEIMRPGATIIVMSTVGPEPVTQVASAAAERGIHLLDVPVTGGTARAITATLNLFASGPGEVIEENAAVLETMGTIIRCGDEVGMGQSYKVVNQLLCSVHIAVAGEALAFAQKLGLDPAAVFPAVATGAGGSWMLSDRGPRMLQGIDAEVTSTIGIFVKDSSLVCDIAEEIGFDAPIVRAARERYLAARDAGLELRDDSAVIRTYLD